MLGCLLFALAIPFAHAVNVNEGGGAFKYQATPIAVNFDAYTASGFLYNTVAELLKAYDLNSLYKAGYTGSGQTVVIVDAYGSPTIYQDLLLFIQWQNSHGASLPWTTMADVRRHMHIYYPLGKPYFNPNVEGEVGWSFETTLDVDMVHAIAPGADIALVIAPNANFGPLNSAVNYAVTHHLGCAISQSWGAPEYQLTSRSAHLQVMQADSIYMSAAKAHITVFASAGDDGAANLGSYNNPLFPASDPYVTAVGGTNLFMTCSDGYVEGTGKWDNATHTGVTYDYEIAGNDYEAMAADGYPSPEDIITTGGAMSSLFALPSWQSGITLTDTSGTTFNPTGRCTSDVSFDSGVYGGLGAIPYTAYPPLAGYYIIGGTSAGSPFWAALTAIACQAAHHSLGYINPTLYKNKEALYTAGAFHDITMGDNTYPTGNTVLGYEARAGWDAPTGIGSADAYILVPTMATWNP
jgi:subtilase family serine protease